ncbi:MAG: AsmA family protein [Bacteroidia bacterium]|nr:AsmA family protein [Bacteroidia bacterium]
MKKSRWLRIALYALAGVMVLFLLLAILIPIFFKDDIKAQIDKEVARSVNAEVNFDLDKFRISLLRNFPHVTVSLDDFNIVGREEFKGDTLLAVNTFRIVVDVWSLLFSEEAKVRAVYLNSPRIYAQVLSNGKASWDIAIVSPEDTTQAEEEEAPTEFNVSIRRWEVDNGQVVYADAQQKIYMRVHNLNHYGNGNFNQDNFDLRTSTSLDNIRLDYDGVSYLENKKLAADMVLNIDVPQSKYTFKKNNIRINDFAFGFDGFVQLKENDIVLDLTYQAQENDFKNILSLVPGVFTQDFDQMKTSGKLAFNGTVKGVYNEKQLPGFGLNLKVTDGMFQYPDLPTAVTNIQTDLSIANKDGDLENTQVDLKRFHMDLGKNPIEAQAKVSGLSRPNIDAQASARLNLADLIQMFPMPGTALRGDFSLNAKIKGIYDAAQQRFPQAKIGCAWSMAT